jgi:ATP-dependent DNA helicase 2 subunit 1
MQADTNWDILADEEDDELQLNGVSRVKHVQTCVLTRICHQYPEALKDVILFAVDCAPSMLKPQNGVGKKRGINAKAAALTAEMPSALHSHLFATLRAAVDLQKKKATYEPNDMVGILLFNTVRTSPLGVRVLTPSTVDGE